MDDLKSKIKKHYKTQKLSDHQLESLENMQIEGKTINLFNIGLPVVATLVFVLMFIFYPSNNTLNKIADEVINNHHKNLPSEYLVDHMVDLNQRLVKLDFKVQESHKLANYEVLGGRYCSIQGNTAAQIKLKNNGITSTLYQSDFTKVDKKKLPFKIIKDGVEVTIWLEGDLLFAKATNKPSH